MSTITKQRPASDKTVRYIHDLLDQKDTTDYLLHIGHPVNTHPAVIERTKRSVGDPDDKAVPRISQNRASGIIETLKPLPYKAREPAQPQGKQSVQFPDIPAGRYALDTDEGVKFYKVDRPDQGRWAGYTFVKRLRAQGYHGLDQLAEVRMYVGQQVEVAKAIAENPEAAMARFGHAIGHCGRCGRELTKDESIKLGIGPVCAGKLGWS